MTVGSVVVLGSPASSAANLAEKLATALGTSQSVVLAPSAAAIRADTDVLVLADDAPPGSDDSTARSAMLAALGEARAAGRPIVIVPDRKGAARWLQRVKDEGLPQDPGPLRRVFVASGMSPLSRDRAATLARALDLPLIEPEAPESPAPAEGWGPRYAAIAGGDRWVVHTPSWHAVEVLAPHADVVVHVQAAPAEAGREFPAPAPEAKKWRVLFAPWLKRYPAVEAQLLARELSGHAHEAPVFRIRSAAEGEIVLQGFLAGARARTG